MKTRAAIFFLFVLAGSAAHAAEGAESPDAERLTTLLERSRASYDTVRDYRAVFKKQEKGPDGALGPQETIFLKFEKPFKIFMHWTDTHKKGLQVLYERGRHDGKLAIHKPGLLLGLARVVFLDRNSPWVREGSESYDIEDAGIGSFLEDFSRMVRQGLSENKIQAQVTTSAFGETAQVHFPGTSSQDRGYFAYRATVFFDGENHLPVRMELKDWQEKTIGLYEYGDLRLNLGAEDPEFKALAERRLYRLYRPAEPKIPAKTNFSSKN